MAPTAVIEPLFGQKVREEVKALARFAEHVALRHLHIGEEEFGSVLRLQTHLLQIAAALEAFHTPFDDEQAESVTAIRVGAGDDDEDVADLTV